MQTDGLWGGVLDRLEMDVRTHAVTMMISVTDGNDSPQVHELRFLNVTELRFFNSIESPWSYAEVTEIGSARLGATECRYDIMLWSEDAGLTIVCSSCTLDGVVLE
jgi:hypothetical protein